MEGTNQTQRYDPAAPAPRIIVIGASLNPNSLSFRLAEAAVDAVNRAGAAAMLLDLRECELPFCGVQNYDSHPSVVKIEQLIQDSDGILLAAPVYNYDLNAAAKNLVELTGDAWAGKPVGFLCAAGGKSSYMSPIGLANSLMFDFRSWIVPRFVYATRGDFDSFRAPSPLIAERIEQLAKATVDMARALQWVKNAPAIAAMSQPKN